MKTKKTMLLLMVAVLLIPSLAFAEGITAEEALDATTQAEIKAMNTGAGAEVRLLQLEEAISRAVLKGEEVVAAYEAEGEDAFALTAILDEMQALLFEVQSADPNSEDAVMQFVDLKADARALVKEFRMAHLSIPNSIGEARLSQIRSRFQEIDQGRAPELSQLRERARNQTREYNAVQLEKMQEALGENATLLISQLRNGELTTEQIRDRIGQTLSTMIVEHRRALAQKASEESARKSVFAQSMAQQARNNFQERQSERAIERGEMAETLRAERTPETADRIGQMNETRQSLPTVRAPIER